MGILSFFTLRERIVIDHQERPTASGDTWGDIHVHIIADSALVRRVRAAVQAALVDDAKAVAQVSRIKP